jgi:hypothetical protein
LTRIYWTSSCTLNGNRKKVCKMPLPPPPTRTRRAKIADLVTANPGWYQGTGWCCDEHPKFVITDCLPQAWVNKMPCSSVVFPRPKFLLLFWKLCAHAEGQGKIKKKGT